MELEVRRTMGFYGHPVATGRVSERDMAMWVVNSGLVDVELRRYDAVGPYPVITVWLRSNGYASGPLDESQVDPEIRDAMVAALITAMMKGEW